VAPDAETGPRSENCHLAHTPLLRRYRMALFVLAMAGELGDAHDRPGWPRSAPGCSPGSRWRTSGSG